MADLIDTLTCLMQLSVKVPELVRVSEFTEAGKIMIRQMHIMRRRADGATGKEVDLLRIALTNGEDPDYLMNAESMVTNRLRALGFGSNAPKKKK